jgi:hypothetical protein
MGRISGKTVVTFCMVLISAKLIFAQTLNLQGIPSNKIQFGLNYNRPFYKDNYGVSSSINIFQLSFNMPISNNFNIMGGIPYIINYYNINTLYYNDQIESRGYGNIYFGAQTNTSTEENTKSIVSFRIYLPTADENASFTGLYGNYYDLQKYLPNALGFYFNYAYHRITNKGFIYGLETGPNLIIPTKSDGSNSEFLVHYGVNGGYQINDLLISAEFLGLMMVSENFQNFSDRFINMIDLGMQWKGHMVVPKIFYQIILKKELNDVVSGILGVGVTVAVDKY